MTGITLLGLAAAACTTASFIPQVVKAWRSGSSADLSLGMYVLLVRDLPIIAANAVALVLVASLLLHILRTWLR